MQQRRPAARQADNEQRLANFLLRDLRIKLPIARQQKSIAQNPNDVATQRHSPDDIQASIALTRFQQARERLDEFVSAKIIEPAATVRFRNQLLRRRKFRSNADFLEHGAAFV
jgi:hypothetical protein